MTGVSSMVTSSTSESELSGSQHRWRTAGPLPLVYTEERRVSDLRSFGARSGVLVPDCNTSRGGVRGGILNS